MLKETRSTRLARPASPLGLLDSARSAPRPPTRPSRRYLLTRRLSYNLPLFLMGLPGIVLLFVFAYLPMIGIIIAFKNYKDALGLFDSPWAGLSNFQFLIGTGQLWQITYNTVFMNLLFIFTGLVVSIGVALLLNEIRDHSRWLPRIYQSLLFFPSFLSYVVISYFLFSFLNADNGTVNSFLTHIGLHPVDWYYSPQYWPAILVVVSLWKGLGTGSIVYLATMVSINPEYYDAARIDGAGKLQQIRFITLPLIKPVVIILTLLSLGGILQSDLGLFYQVTRNSAALYSSTDVISTFVFRALTGLGNLGMAGAASLYQSAFGFMLVIVVNTIIRRISPERALF